MAPEQIAGTNMWYLKGNEFFAARTTSGDTEITGPAFIIVEPTDAGQIIKVRFAGKLDRKVYLETTTFPKCVQTRQK
ncbi:MAG: hypothetical protein WC686_05535 [Candidatus Shapirobacteria bacterium]|jgi:hypothetical protein